MLQQNLPAIPERLLPFAEKYEASPMRGGDAPKWPAYAVLYSWLLDRSKTFKQIGDDIGVSRERVRQVCNRYFPRVRPKKDRHAYGRPAKKVPGATEPKARCYEILKKYAHELGLTLHPLRNKRGIIPKSYSLEGRSAQVVHITAAFENRCSRGFWAKTPIERRKKLREHELLIVIIDVEREGLSWSACYAAWSAEFLAAGSKFVLICNAGRGNGGRPIKFDWHSRQGLGHLGLTKSA